MSDAIPSPENNNTLDQYLFTDEVNIGGQIYYYLTVPYPGCTKPVPCDFCAFAGTGIPNLPVDERLGSVVMRKVEQCLSRHPDTLVVLNNGNILNGAEMHAPTILEHIPRAVAAHPTCHALEIEVSVKDLQNESTWNKLHTIRRNLAENILCVRVPVEFANDELLARHHKGVTMDDVRSAIIRLNAEQIPWVGYALLGGAGMTAEESRTATIETGKFVMDQGARMLSINGMFLTRRIQERQRQSGQQIYVPSIEDLMEVLKELFDYGALRGPMPLIKLGLAEEDGGLDIAQYPYSIPADDPESQKRMIGVLRDFNGCQQFNVFTVAVIRSWAKELFRRLPWMPAR